MQQASSPGFKGLKKVYPGRWMEGILTELEAFMQNYAQAQAVSTCMLPGCSLWVFFIRFCDSLQEIYLPMCWQSPANAPA